MLRNLKLILKGINVSEKPQKEYFGFFPELSDSVNNFGVMIMLHSSYEALLYISH